MNIGDVGAMAAVSIPGIGYVLAVHMLSHSQRTDLTPEQRDRFEKVAIFGLLMHCGYLALILSIPVVF